MLSDFEGVKFEALTQSAIDIFSQIVSISTRYQEEFAIIADNIDHPGRLADYIASIISLKTEDKQRMLELMNVKDRFNELVKMLSKELNLVELESMIQSDAEAEINQSQKEFFLREQIRAIQKELGDTEDLSVEIDEYRAQIKHLNLPEKAPEAAGRELMMKRKKQSQHKSRLFLGIVFKCCNIYSRIHLNKKRTAFVGWCPKCGKPARVKVSPTGSKSRFFSAY